MPLPPTSFKTVETVQERLLQPLLHMGFALSGAGTVLLGTILPRLSSEWHLRDRDAGLVLLAQFAASASGALLVRRNLWKTLALGYTLCGAAAIAISLLPQSAFPPVLAALALFGLGLGLAMTSTNMLVSRHNAHRRGAALAMLNCSWSAGAVACPLLVGSFFSESQAGRLFGLLGCLLIPFALLPRITRGAEWRRELTVQSIAPGLAQARVIVYFALLAFLYVGVETTIGNWLSTYTARVTARNFAGSSMAVAAFWGALLLGRGLTSSVLNRLTERLLYQLSTVIVAGGVLFLLGAHSTPAVFAGAAVTGIALAPLFPLTISLFLAEVGESRNAGWVFALAGLGGAGLSWLTGLVSTGSGSLRVGLLVPGAAALLMMALIAGRTDHSRLARV